MFRNKYLYRLSTFRIILLSFAGAILTGAFLLCLPFARRGAPVSFLDALFTATSAVCVTGLVVRDTYLGWSIFGRVSDRRHGRCDHSHSAGDCLRQKDFAAPAHAPQRRDIGRPRGRNLTADVVYSAVYAVLRAGRNSSDAACLQCNLRHPAGGGWVMLFSIPSLRSATPDLTCRAAEVLIRLLHGTRQIR